MTNKKVFDTWAKYHDFYTTIGFIQGILWGLSIGLSLAVIISKI